MQNIMYQLRFQECFVFIGGDVLFHFVSQFMNIYLHFVLKILNVES